MDFRSVDQHNNTPVPDFDGLTPSDMYQMLYGDFQDCVIRVCDNPSAVENVPIAALLNALLREIDSESGLKLTAAGYLPVKIVKALYAKHLLSDELIDEGISKLTSESDTFTIQTVRIVAELAGYIRKRNGRLMLTKKGKALATAGNTILSLLTTFGEKYNLGYRDRYRSEQIAQVGYRYSLYLLKKHGDQPRNPDFYANRYFRAFPFLRTDETSDRHCYSVRTFNRFFYYFGFSTEPTYRNPSVRKTNLLDQFIEYNPHPAPPKIDVGRIVPDWGPPKN